MKSPKVSIIVPVWNVEKYLDRCLNSLVNQTLKEIEIILVDDKSPDKCPQMCDEWAKRDSRIKVIHKQKNEGLGFARNSGIDMAQGEYITFPDSDDYIDQTAYEKLYSYAVMDKVDAVYFEFNTDEYPGFHAISYPDGLYEGRKALEGIMLDMIGAEPDYQSDVKFQVSAAKVLYKLSLIKEHNIRFVSERQIISEDLIWNLDFLNKAKAVKTIGDRFYHYCLNMDSLSHIYRPDRYKRLSVMANYLEKYINMFEDKDDFHLRLCRTRLFFLRTHVLSLAQQKSFNEILKCLDNKDIVDSINKYPTNKMPIRYRAFYFVLKKRLLFVIKLFNIGKNANDRKRQL